jgi:hypothetical protein
MMQGQVYPQVGARYLKNQTTTTTITGLAESTDCHNFNYKNTRLDIGSKQTTSQPAHSAQSKQPRLAENTTTNASDWLTKEHKVIFSPIEPPIN